MSKVADLNSNTKVALFAGSFGPLRLMEASFETETPDGAVSYTLPRDFTLYNNEARSLYEFLKEIYEPKQEPTPPHPDERALKVIRDRWEVKKTYSASEVDYAGGRYYHIGDKMDRIPFELILFEYPEGDFAILDIKRIEEVE